MAKPLPVVVVTEPSKFGGYGSDKIATAKNYAKTKG
jgi:hypothetical protein